jgi:RHS repeat-associated protein
LGDGISRDPIGESDGPNIYAFVQNQPLTGIDTLGDQGFFIPTGPGQYPVG